MKIFLDFETVGFYGMPVLLQYAVDDEPDIVLYDIWKKPVRETLALVRWIVSNDVVGFNLAFDLFHLCKLYTTFERFAEDYDGLDAIPEDYVDEIAISEFKARMGPCVKPARCCDVMLHARKGKYQALMAREKVRVRRVPTSIAWELADELEKRVEVDEIFFSKRKDKLAPKWGVFDTKDRETGEDTPLFKDVVLRFAPSAALKNLAIHALNIPPEEILRFGDVELADMYRPAEFGYAPFALAVGKPGEWNKSWPQMIKYHISHWAYNELARKYATSDVDYTRRLYHHFGSPEPGDDDSELAGLVAAVRWRGFKINMPAMRALRTRAKMKFLSTPLSPARARAYITEVMRPLEKTIIGGSTKKVVLEQVAGWECDCEGAGCPFCNHTGKHPAALRAKEVLAARKAKKEDELYAKLLKAGRFHASFVVIGTLSSRMAGSDKLNPQAINATDVVRDCFSLADPGFILCGGDFDAFEIVLADAVYGDENLRLDLKSGKKIHALFAQELFPGKSYEDILASKGMEDDMYHDGKQGVFTLVYAGNEVTLNKKLNIPLEVGKAAFEKFMKKYPGIARSRRKIESWFCTMSQKDGLGSKISWEEPKDYVESLFGFRRYFTLENSITKALFELATHIPKHWEKYDEKVVRNPARGVQKVAGAVRSALYASAFGIQGANMRAAANHEIQSSGAQITKRVQRCVWDVQPCGVNDWRVVPMNIHDEILAPCRPEFVTQVQEAVYAAVESFRPRIPLIKMEWAQNLESWSKGFTKSIVDKIRGLWAEGKTDDEVAAAMKIKEVKELQKARDWPTY